MAEGNDEKSDASQAAGDASESDADASESDADTPESDADTPESDADTPESDADTSGGNGGGTAEPALAATVVLARPRDGVPFEVFLVRRHSRAKFMANAFVYPGGRLEEADKSERFQRHFGGIPAALLAQRLGVEDDVASGLFVAAIREVFEEAGALLAQESDGRAIDLADPAELERYEVYREMLLEEEVDFDRMVEWEDLVLRVDQLVYFAHWITPPIEAQRFDTYFFLAPAPEGQLLTHDEKETTASRWITPADALSAHERGELWLAPPTLHTLHNLAQFHSLDEALDYYPERKVPAVHPELHQVGDQIALLFPGDPDYPRSVELAVEGATRVLLGDGRWWIVDPEAPDGQLH